MRINKLFSNYGICSRKETNKLIDEQRIKVNGKTCVLGQWVEEGKDEILLDNEPIVMKEKIYIGLNKPVGVTCTAENNVKDNIIDYMKYPQYIFPVGRLDKESQGLIIMTNDGDLANAILECDNLHEKEYIVEVNKDIDDKFIKQMSEGVEIKGHEGSGVKRISDEIGIYKFKSCEENTLSKQQIDNISVIKLKDLKKNEGEAKNKVRTRPCTVNKINEHTFKIILTQGLNKQIRKMCGAMGYKVTKLERIRIMNISMNGIEYGKWRYLNENEIIELKEKAFS